MNLPSRPARPQQTERPGVPSLFASTYNNAPASPQFTGKPVEGGDKAPSRRLRGRLIQDGERSYTAYSADELIEIYSLAHHGRPGMPY